jgi:DUF4097 and DUF4098 domain-containing protein YvlB
MAQEKWLVLPGQSKTIDVEVVRKLKVGLIGGQVDIIGHDEPGARIEVHSVSGKELKISIDGDTLEIDHPQLRWDNFLDVFRSWTAKAKADVSVLVPRDVALKFGVISASALVSGLRTDAKLSTVSGDVTVDGVIGDLDLNAVSGELSVRGHSGSISAHTVSGDITATGMLPKFSADAVSGNIFLDLTGTPDTIVTNSVSGDLTLRLDADVSARYRVNTVSGSIQFENTIIRTSAGKGYNYQEGALDGSWVDVTANSVSGNLSVIRRLAAPSADTHEPAGSEPTNGAVA